MQHFWYWSTINDDRSFCCCCCWYTTVTFWHTKEMLNFWAVWEHSLGIYQDHIVIQKHETPFEDHHWSQQPATIRLNDTLITECKHRNDPDMFSWVIIMRHDGWEFDLAGIIKTTLFWLDRAYGKKLWNSTFATQSQMYQIMLYHV